jgi:glycosyltransferase involved in cell wall biosynthesis
VHRVWTYLAPNVGTWRRTLNYLSFMLTGTWRGIRTPRPDVVIATSPQFFVGWAGVFVSRLRRRPFVLEIRDIWPESIEAVGALGRRSWFKSFALKGLEVLERLMYRAARRVVTVGDGYAAQLKRRGVQPEKINVITNGVDDVMFEPLSPDPRLRALAGALPEHTLVGYIGTVGLAHGLEVLLEAARAARATGDDSLRFVVVGDGARRAQLEAQLATDDPTNIRFTGLQPKALMPAWLASVDVCLVHLRDTPLFATVLPSKFIEAAAAARPVILGVRGGVADLAREWDAAEIIEPESAIELLRAAQRLARSPHKRQEMAARARALAWQRFRVDVLARSYLDLLHACNATTCADPSRVGLAQQTAPFRSFSDFP